LPLTSSMVILSELALYWLMLAKLGTVSSLDTYTPDVLLATFDGVASTTQSWLVVNDSRIGGTSIGSFVVTDSAVEFEGRVDEMLAGSPGFVVAHTNVTKFPAMWGCQGLTIAGSVTGSFTGFKISFGTGELVAKNNLIGAYPSEGYKAAFSLPVGDSEVYVPFEDFSRDWTDAPGHPRTTCAEDTSVCPTFLQEQNMQIVQLWAEGVKGPFRLHLHSIRASKCYRPSSSTGSASTLGGSSSHYAAPPCARDEISFAVAGTDGKTCSPKCGPGKSCPSDVPEGTTAKPSCALKDQTGVSYCALVCFPFHSSCPAGASCKRPSGAIVGYCVYPSDSVPPTLKTAVEVQDILKPKCGDAGLPCALGDGPPMGPPDRAICPVSGAHLNVTQSSVKIYFKFGQALYFKGVKEASMYKSSPRDYWLSPHEMPLEGVDGIRGLPDLRGQARQCPRTNETTAITMQTPRVIHRHGQAVYFCCFGCVVSFWKDPSVYLA